MTEQQKLAVVLLNDGYKVRDVSQQIKIPYVVLRKWLGEPWFTRERYIDMSMRFSESVPRAMAVLIEVMEDVENKGSERIKAATEILDRAGFIVQRDVKLSLGEQSADRGGVFKMSVDELKEQWEKVNDVLKMIDVTPDEQLEIASEIFTEDLSEECANEQQPD